MQNAPKFQVDKDKTIKIAKILKKKDYILPKFELPKNLEGKNNVDLALYLTYVISINYMTVLKNFGKKRERLMRKIQLGSPQKRF